MLIERDGILKNDSNTKQDAQSLCDEPALDDNNFTLILEKPHPRFFRYFKSHQL